MLTKEQIYDFIKDCQLAVISTTHANGTPEAAVIAIGQTEKLELIFRTSSTSRKYKNITQNPRVAFVIGWNNGETIQYEGIARRLQASELDIINDTYLSKHPYAAKFSQDPNNAYFIVTPHWIRHTTIKTDPWTANEITL